MADYFTLCALLSSLPDDMLFGAGHIVFEDGNLSDSSIDFCIRETYGLNGTPRESITQNDVVAVTILALLKYIPEELRERPDPEIVYEDEDA